MKVNSDYLNENKNNFQKYSLINRDEEIFLGKLYLLSEKYDLEHPTKIKDDENIFDNLFILKTPKNMRFQDKNSIWKMIVDEMYEFSKSCGLINYYYNNSIILE